jgi:aspartate beta-hydroxylase
VSTPELRNPAQHCPHWIPGLRAQPWWPAEAFSCVAELESLFPWIREELFDLALQGRLRLHPQSQDGPRKQLADGDWSLFELCSSGVLNTRNAMDTPVTAGALASFPDLCSHRRGLAYFSVLSPGVHVEPHCGATNSRLRIHLGLSIPQGAVLRVGDETRPWQEGKCLVFDDSFEHEAWNPSESARAVLLIDMWHPDISVQDRRQLASEAPPDEVLTRQREGWMRGADGRTCEAEGRMLLSLLPERRLQRLRASAARMAASSEPLIAKIGRCAESLLRHGLAEGVSSVADAEASQLWDALGRWWRDCSDSPLEIQRNLDELHLTSFTCWRHPAYRSKLAEFLLAWSPSEKQNILDTLCSLDSPKEMPEHLASYSNLSFSAAAGLVVVAIRRHGIETLSDHTN